MGQNYKPSFKYSIIIRRTSLSRLSGFVSCSPKCCKNSSVAWQNVMPLHFILPAINPNAIWWIAFRLRIFGIASAPVFVPVFIAILFVDKDSAYFVRTTLTFSIHIFCLIATVNFTMNKFSFTVVLMVPVLPADSCNL